MHSIAIISFTVATNAFCEGEGWVSYKDEKCFKLIQQFATRQEAVDICKGESLNQTNGDYPILASVKTVEEQTFLSKYLFETEAIEVNVWLGVQNVR